MQANLSGQSVTKNGTDEGGSTSWYALLVGPNRQFRVRAKLREIAVEEYLPTFREMSRWSDRERSIERPLFPGYVLARFNLSDQRAEIEGIPGVLGIASCGTEASAIPPIQVEDLRRVAENATSPRLCGYGAGQTVEIMRGPLAGITGTIRRTVGPVRLIVAIEFLRRAVSVEIDAADLDEETMQ